MPYWVKQYRDTKGLNLISSTALNEEDYTTGTSSATSGGLFLQLTWKQFESPLSFVPSPVSTISNSSSNNSSDTTSSSVQQQDEKYVVILTPSNGGKVFNPYKLYSSRQKNKAEEALSSLRAILKHLTSIPLSPDLLSLLILPSPKPVEELPQTLAQYAVKLSPTTSVEWAPLAKLSINGLPLAYCMCELTNMAILKTLHETPGVNLALSHPITGATLVSMAAQINDDTVREIIDYLRDRLDRERYQEHINKSSSEEESSTTSSTAAASLYRQSSSLRMRASRSWSMVTEESLLSVEKVSVYN